MHLFAAEQPPLTIFHIARRYDSDQAARQAAKHDEGQAAIKRFAQGNVELLTRSPDLIVADKNLFDLAGVN